jgi:Flp pilus assembly protein TadG
VEARVRDNRRAGNVIDESGQGLMLAALFMAMLLVMVALVVDIGKADLVQRQLQAGADAAALAGAQQKVIVPLSDGAANSTPRRFPTISPTTRCASIPARRASGPRRTQ